MEEFILTLGFLGAWLLFAGPIYQAALELKEENVDLDQATMEGIVKPAPISVWWWLIPPVKIYLEHRRSEAVRKLFVDALSAKEIEGLISFMNKATAWLYVATGGLCIAAKETYELVDYKGWNLVVFWILMIGLGFASIMNVIIRFRRSKVIMGAKNKAE